MLTFRFAIVLFAITFTLPSIAEAQRRSSRDDGGDSISFVKDVAPIITAKCGKCHVSSAKGRYDIKSFEALIDSDSIVARQPDDSLFIQVIENGEMPKGGIKVSDKELDTLRDWISEGAKFDGDDESQLVSQMGGGDSKSGSRSRSSTGGRRPSRSRSRRSSKPNAIEVNPILAFFDTNGDGELSLQEIDAAKRLLYSLDTNEDDRLTSDEVRDLK